jgi:hypothetical protein
MPDVMRQLWVLVLVPSSRVRIELAIFFMIMKKPYEDLHGNWEMGEKLRRPKIQ